MCGRPKLFHFKVHKLFASHKCYVRLLPLQKENFSIKRICLHAVNVYTTHVICKINVNQWILCVRFALNSITNPKIRFKDSGWCWNSSSLSLGYNCSRMKYISDVNWCFHRWETTLSLLSLLWHLTWSSFSFSIWRRPFG